MKRTIIYLSVLASLMGAGSCSKCYVCKDKTSNEFSKYEYCDKDFDKGDVKAAIDAAEAGGAVCHAKTRAF
jgi:hypothetical protein